MGRLNSAYSATKLREYRRMQGKPALASEEETQQAFMHIRLLHKSGMSLIFLAKETGISDSTLSRYIKGTSNAHPSAGRPEMPICHIRRESYDKVMALKFKQQPLRNKSGKILGSRINPTATRRMIQALMCLGYGQPFLAKRLNKDKAHIGHMAAGNQGRRYIQYGTYLVVKRIYDELSNKDPRDFGLSPYQIGRAKGAARRHGWAPPICWDSDTIHDPEAIPQWTGHCGSTRGYYIHEREGIEPCEPCVVAYSKSHPNERSDESNSSDPEGSC